jgi:hypothetical protein
LHILCELARSIRKRVAGSADSELVDEVDELLELLQDRLAHCEKVLAEHGIPLPYYKG